MAALADTRRGIRFGAVYVREYLRTPGGGCTVPEDDATECRWPLGMDNVVPVRDEQGVITGGTPIDFAAAPAHRRADAAVQSNTRHIRSCLRRRSPRAEAAVGAQEGGATNGEATTDLPAAAPQAAAPAPHAAPHSHADACNDVMSATGGLHAAAGHVHASGAQHASLPRADTASDVPHSHPSGGTHHVSSSGALGEGEECGGGQDPGPFPPDPRPGVLLLGSVDAVVEWKAGYDVYRRTQQRVGAGMGRGRGKKKRGGAVARAAAAMGIPMPIFRCLTPLERKALMEAERVESHMTADALAAAAAEAQTDARAIMASRRTNKMGCQCMVLSMSDVRTLTLKKLRQQLSMFGLATAGSRTQLQYRLLQFSRTHGGCMHPKPPSMSSDTSEAGSPSGVAATSPNAADGAAAAAVNVTPSSASAPSPSAAAQEDGLEYLHADAHEFCAQPRHSFASQPQHDAHVHAEALATWVREDHAQYFAAALPGNAASPPASPSTESSTTATSPSSAADLVAKLSTCPCTESGIGCHWGTCWCCQDCCSNRRVGDCTGASVDVEADVYRQMIGLLTYTRRVFFLQPDEVAAAWTQLKAASSDDEDDSSDADMEDGAAPPGRRMVDADDDDEGEEDEEEGADVPIGARQVVRGKPAGLSGAAMQDDVDSDSTSSSGLESDGDDEDDDTIPAELAAASRSAALEDDEDDSALAAGLEDAHVRQLLLAISAANAAATAAVTSKPASPRRAAGRVLEVDGIMVTESQDAQASPPAPAATRGKRRRHETEVPPPSQDQLAAADAALRGAAPDSNGTDTAWTSEGVAAFVALHRKRARVSAASETTIATSAIGDAGTNDAASHAPAADDGGTDNRNVDVEEDMFADAVDVAKRAAAGNNTPGPRVHPPVAIPVPASNGSIT